MNSSKFNENLSAMINVSEDGSGKFCRNAYMDRMILNKAQCGVITAILVLEMATAMSLNTLLIKGIYKQNMVGSVTWYYVLLLGYAGCSLSLVIMPLNILLFTVYRSSRSCTLEYVTIFLGQTNCQFIGYLILLLASHRYLMTVPHTKLRISCLTSNFASRIVIVSVFGVSLLHGGASINFFGAIETPLPNIAMKIVDVTIGLVICVIYLRLYRRVRQYAANARVRFADNAVHVEQDIITSTERKPKYIKRLAVTISLILLALASCYIPFIIMDAWTSWYTFYQCQQAPQNVRFIYYLTYGSVFFTSILNAVIIIQRNKEMKLYVKSTICIDFFKSNVHPVLKSTGGF